jgi:hypothetical protein
MLEAKAPENHNLIFWCKRNEYLLQKGWQMLKKYLLIIMTKMLN